jgi:hypothetical protein
MTQGRDCRKHPPITFSAKPFCRAVDKLVAEVAVQKRETVARLSAAKWTPRAWLTRRWTVL